MMQNTLLIAENAGFGSLCLSAFPPLPFASEAYICRHSDQSQALMAQLRCELTGKVRLRRINGLYHRRSCWIQSDGNPSFYSLVLLCVWFWIKYPNTTWDPIKMYWSLWGAGLLQRQEWWYSAWRKGLLENKHKITRAKNDSESNKVEHE